MMRIVFWALIVLGVAVHILLALFTQEPVNGDYQCFLRSWMEQIHQGGGLPALADSFYNYSPAYMYLLTLLSSLGLTNILWVRLLSAIFDYVCAYWVGRIAQRNGCQSGLLAAFAIVPLLPTVLINSSYWAQCDAIYSSFALASLFLFWQDRPWASMSMFGVSFAFKAQCIFLSPFFFVMLLQRRLGWHHLLAVVAVYVLSILPVWICGRPFWDLMTIYATQVSFYDKLTMNCPNLYVWLGNVGNVDLVRFLGCGFVAVASLALGFSLRGVKISGEKALLLALFVVLFVVFFLPGMHERYLFVGDMLAATLFIIHWRRYMLLAGLVLSCSFLSYLMCTSASVYLSLRPISLLLFASIIVSARQFFSIRSDE